MISIVRTIFRRLYDVDPVAEEAKLRLNEEEFQHGDISMSVSADVSDDAAAAANSDAPVDTSTPASVLQTEISSAAMEDVATQPIAVTADVGEDPPFVAPPKPCRLYNASLSAILIYGVRWSPSPIGTFPRTCQHPGSQRPGSYGFHPLDCSWNFECHNRNLRNGPRRLSFAFDFDCRSRQQISFSACAFRQPYCITSIVAYQDRKSVV